MPLTRKQTKRLIEIARIRPSKNMPRIVAIGGNGVTDCVIDFTVTRFAGLHALRFRVTERCPQSPIQVAETILNAFGDEFSSEFVGLRDFIIYDKTLFR